MAHALPHLPQLALSVWRFAHRFPHAVWPGAQARAQARGRRLSFGIRLHFIDVLLNLRYKGANVLNCDANYQKGKELGWFEHGSTIILICPPGFHLVDNITEGLPIRMGEPLMSVSG